MISIHRLVISLATIYVLFTTSAVVGNTSTAKTALQDTFSPRNYCRSTNGIVTETNNPEVYICCYKSKCILCDTRKGTSEIIAKGGKRGR